MGVEAGNRHDTKQKSNEGHPSHTPIHVFQASKLRKGSRSGAAPHGSPVLSRISYRLPQHSSRSTIKNTPGVSKNKPAELVGHAGHRGLGLGHHGRRRLRVERGRGQRQRLTAAASHKVLQSHLGLLGSAVWEVRLMGWLVGR